MSQGESRIEQLESYLKKHRPLRIEPNTQSVHAAVIAVVRNMDDSLDLLFIRRAERAEDPWSGQIAFPGGRQHAGDRSTLETALRETKEELGIDLSRHGRIIGSLSDTTSHLGNLIITPYVACVPYTIEIRTNAEVSEYFWIPIDGLNKVSNFPVTVRGDFLLRDAYVFGERVIWGLTARIIDDLLTCMKSTKQK